MPRLEQTVAYSIQPVVPTTTGKIPVFATTGNPSKATDSQAFREADGGNQVIIGLGASVGGTQVAGTTATTLGKGAVAWGQNSVAIGENAGAGQATKLDGTITMGGNSATGKNGVRIGSALAFGAAFADYVSLGTQAQNGGQNSVIIGTAAGGQTESIAIGDTASGGEPWAVAIGYHAACPNSGNGTGSKCIAIGYQASASVSSPGDQAAIAIGRDATCQGAHGIAIGTGATISPSTTLHSIAIGHGATSAASNECVIGDTTNGPINKLRIKSAAATALRILTGAGGGGGGSGALVIQDVGGVTDVAQFDKNTVAGESGFMLYDVSTALLKRVTFGAGAGVAGDAANKYLRVVV